MSARADPENSPGGAAAEKEAGSGGRARRWLRTAGKLALTVAVTWFILDRVGVTWAEVAALDRAEWRPAWGALLLSALLLLAGYLLAALLWGRMTEELGEVRVPGPAALRIHFTANLARYVPGKVWQLAGTAWLAGRSGIPVGAAVGSAVLGQALALAGATLVGSAVFVRGPGLSGPAGTLALGVVVLVLVVVTVPPLHRLAVSQGFRVLRRDPPRRLADDPLFGLRWLALYTVVWSVFAAAFWLMVHSFGVTGSPVDVGPAFAAAYVLGYLALFAPAGLGVREGFLVAFLGPVTGPGAAVALAVIARFWSTVVELVPALIFAGIELRRGGTPVSGKESGDDG